MSTHEDTIRAAFIRLRTYTDPRGHGLLDSLEEMLLTQDEGQDALVAAVNRFPTDIWSVRDDLLEPQPKDDGYHALMADVYDIREKGR